VRSSDPRAPEVGFCSLVLFCFALFCFVLLCFVLFCFVLFSYVIFFDRLRYFPWVRSLVCFYFLLLCITSLAEGGPLSPPFGAGRQTGKGKIG